MSWLKCAMRMSLARTNNVIEVHTRPKIDINLYMREIMIAQIVLRRYEHLLNNQSSDRHTDRHSACIKIMETKTRSENNAAFKIWLININNFFLINMSQ